MYQVNPNIKQAETLNASFYSDLNAWEQLKEKVFAKSWQYVGDEQEIFSGPENIYPFWLLEQYLDEPLLLSKQEEEVQCLSNVCTHRGFLLVNHPSKMKKIVCGYHGRRFALDGKFESMPEFKEAEGFPRPCDHLHQIPLERWRQFLFTSLDPVIDFNQIKASDWKKE